MSKLIYVVSVETRVKGKYDNSVKKCFVPYDKAYRYFNDEIMRFKKNREQKVSTKQCTDEKTHIVARDNFFRLSNSSEGLFFTANIDCLEVVQ